MYKFVKENNDKYLNKVDKNFARKLEKIFYWAEKLYGVNMYIISGVRGYAEQEKLYQNYLSGVGGLAAPPGRSYHNYGLAIDFKLVDQNGKTVYNAGFYNSLIALALSAGLVSGLQFKDVPHIQDSLNKNVNALYAASFALGKQPKIDNRGMNLMPWLVGGGVASAIIIGSITYIKFRKHE